MVVALGTTARPNYILERFETDDNQVANLILERWRKKLPLHSIRMTEII